MAAIGVVVAGLLACAQVFIAAALRSPVRAARISGRIGFPAKADAGGVV